MILSFIILILVGAIAFFHYVQGFFSATISAILTGFCAVLAVGYHEQLATALLRGGKFTDYASAISLCCLFAGSYIILRVIVDKLIPGNIRMPVIVDKVGAGVMGVIVGLLATGIIAVAAQTMPMGPSIAGYARYPLLSERTVVLPRLHGRSQDTDAKVYDELKNDDISGNSLGLLLPVDDLVIGLTSMLSNGGSLSGDVKFTKIHPDYLQEAFGNRLGVDVGASHSALNLNNRNDVSVKAMYTLSRVEQLDAEFAGVRTRDPALTKVLKPDADQFLLVVRIVFGVDMSDNDKLIRISPGSIRLVAGNKNHFPIGTVADGRTLYSNKVDDPIFIEGSKPDSSADVAFLLNRADVVSPERERPTVLPEVFIEVKRWAKVDISGNIVEPGLAASESMAVLRKGKPTPQTIANIPQAPVAPPKITQEVFAFSSARVSDKLFMKIGVSTAEEDASVVQIAGGVGSCSLKKKKLETLTLDTMETITRVNDGDNLIDTFYLPAGKKMIQIQGTPSTDEKADPWQWANRIGEFELMDAKNGRFKPAGAWAKIKSKGVDYMLAHYAVDGMMNPIAKQDGRPMDVWISFIVPEDFQPAALLLGVGSIADITAVGK